VSDDGPGLSSQARSVLFEPFRTTRPGHLGIGLAVARDIAVGAGGSLREEPAPGGVGACFVVDLPAAP
jgi:C4-dicarboxylate-specific signal transduction histidine kinase